MHSPPPLETLPAENQLKLHLSKSETNLLESTTSVSLFPTIPIVFCALFYCCCSQKNNWIIINKWSACISKERNPPWHNYVQSTGLCYLVFVYFHFVWKRQNICALGWWDNSDRPCMSLLAYLKDGRDFNLSYCWVGRKTLWKMWFKDKLAGRYRSVSKDRVVRAKELVWKMFCPIPPEGIFC